jgi:hypothetical protein
MPDLGREMDKQAGREALAVVIRGFAVGFGFCALLGLAVGANWWSSPLCAVASIGCLVLAHKVAKPR